MMKMVFFKERSMKNFYYQITCQHLCLKFNLKIENLQKHLFDLIGAGTITPNFLSKKKFEEQNKTLDIEYFAMLDKFYKVKR